MGRKSYPRVAGVVMITSKRTLHTYLRKTLNVRRSIMDIKNALKKGTYFQCPEMQAEYNLYGAKFFAFGCLDEIKVDLSLNTEKHYFDMVSDLFAEALVSVQPYFNTRYHKVKPWLTMDREHISNLGTKTNGRHHWRYSFLRRKSGFWVITNRKTGKRGVGYSENIGKQLIDMRCKVSGGKGGANQNLQKDWSTHGQDSFYIEYIECSAEGEELDALYEELYERIKPEYSKRTVISQRPSNKLKV